MKRVKCIIVGYIKKPMKLGLTAVIGNSHKYIKRASKTYRNVKGQIENVNKHAAARLRLIKK
jgi:hypothetical protein